MGWGPTGPGDGMGSGDGIPNGMEFVYLTDPFLADSDGDGLNDYQEVMGVFVVRPPVYN